MYNVYSHLHGLFSYQIIKSLIKITRLVSYNIIITSSALRIHLSENTRLLLEQWGTFIVERRGEVELKGRGRMLTHWLLHCSEQEARVVTPDPQPPQYPILFPALPPLMHAPYLVVDPPTLAA